jgi:hypothetical protein
VFSGFNKMGKKEMRNFGEKWINVAEIQTNGGALGTYQ